MRVTLGAVLGSLLLLALLASLTSGCASRVVYVHQGPPPLKVELKTAPPHAEAVWIPGRWAWNGHTHRYVWVAGHWEIKPKGKVWIPGHWKETPRGWVWVKGHWQR
jgi:hypothetical protein